MEKRNEKNAKQLVMGFKLSLLIYEIRETLNFLF